MATDFHIYPAIDSVSLVMDVADPQRDELFAAMEAVFNLHERSREADECRKLGRGDV